MNLHVWWDEPADGPGNMAADELLADEALARGDCCVRIYGWRATTVSLGGFQRQADAAAAPALARLPLVRRPSGGGAIVHGSDLTYAAAVPRSHPWGGRPQALYDAVHESLRLALSDIGIGVELWRPAPPAGSAEREDGPFLCFDRRASGDVVIGAAGAAGGRGHKLLGSAQRRLAATVLQHGSLLLRRNPDVAAAASHPGLEELAGRGFPADAVAGLAARWMEVLAAGLGMRLIREQERRMDDGAVRQRAAWFADPRWTARR